jgi:hypothetical protein
VIHFRHEQDRLGKRTMVCVSELLPERTSDERDERDDERDERQRERELEEERPPHHEPR